LQLNPCLRPASLKKTSPDQDPAATVSVSVSSKMNPSAQLVCLRQGERTIEEYVMDFIELAPLTCFNEECLMIFFRGGLSEPLSSVMPLHDPNGTLEQYIELALQLSGSPLLSYLTVGVVEECDTLPNHVMAAAKENTHKMAATTTTTRHADLPEPSHVSADLLEQRHVYADLPESSHVSVDLLERIHVFADLPEPSQFSTDRLESRHVSGFVRVRRGLRTSVADPPLTSARAAGIPKPLPAASHTSPPAASHPPWLPVAPDPPWLPEFLDLHWRPRSCLRLQCTHPPSLSVPFTPRGRAFWKGGIMSRSPSVPGLHFP